MPFGMCITVLAYTIGGRSGGHINGAVTLGLFAAKQIKAPNGSSEYKDAAQKAHKWADGLWDRCRAALGHERIHLVGPPMFPYLRL